MVCLKVVFSGCCDDVFTLDVGCDDVFSLDVDCDVVLKHCVFSGC